MISLKTPRETDIMRSAGIIAANALRLAGEAVAAKVTTKELEKIIQNHITAQGAKPSFLGYHGFPASACISINSEVIHGIPSDRKIKTGDIVSVDIGVFKDGYHADTAATFAAGQIAQRARLLLDTTEKALSAAIKAATAGNRIGDISAAIQAVARRAGFSAVEAYVGHGVGGSLHEEPSVPNVGRAGRGERLRPGMTLAIEPMINEGVCDVRLKSDNWTVITADGKLSAHFEHTVLITKEGPVVLTALE
jgi:methionyl aminopeptidase